MKLCDKLLACYYTGVPALVWGRPGIGKTASIKYLAKELNADSEVIISSIREPSDFIGLPYRTDNGVKFSPPGWVNTFSDNNPGILFFDEISTCTPNIQAALLNIVLDGKVGEYQLPNTVYRIAASNFTDCFGNNQLNPALCNRFIHIDCKVDLDEFCDMLKSDFNYSLAKLVNNKLNMDQYNKYKDQFKLEICKFLKIENEEIILSAEVPQDVNSPMDYAFASPRSWTNVLTILATLNGSDEELIRELIIGTIGEKVGDRFWTYIQSRLYRKFRIGDHINDFSEAFNLDKLQLSESELDIVLREIISYVKNNLVDNAKGIIKHTLSELNKPGYAPFKSIYESSLISLLKESDPIGSVAWDINNIPNRDLLRNVTHEEEDIVPGIDRNLVHKIRDMMDKGKFQIPNTMPFVSDSDLNKTLNEIYNRDLQNISKSGC